MSMTNEITREFAYANRAANVGRWKPEGDNQDFHSGLGLRLPHRPSVPPRGCFLGTANDDCAVVCTGGRQHPGESAVGKIAKSRKWVNRVLKDRPSNNCPDDRQQFAVIIVYFKVSRD